MPNGSGIEWTECLLIIGTGYRVKVFSLILNSSVGLSAGIQSAGDLVQETLWVQILHSAEEDNLSPFDLKIACLCQCIEINNKHAHVQTLFQHTLTFHIKQHKNHPFWTEVLIIHVYEYSIFLLHDMWNTYFYCVFTWYVEYVSSACLLCHVLPACAWSEMTEMFKQTYGQNLHD